MNTLSSSQAYLAAATSGAILWLATSVLSGRREAWDSSLYWAWAYPAGIVLAALLGYVAPDRPWRWGLTLMLAQAVTLALGASGFGLLPLGLIMFSVLAVPPIGAAAVAAWARGWRHGG